jgi:NAD(P)-dependent dehydrogenase (short-subunit alcohol dehydrogenase family)
MQDAFAHCEALLRAADKDRFLTTLFAPAEHRNALVVNLSSLSGKSGQPWLSVYSATKAAVIGFSEATQKEVASDGIQVTALCPGFVDTPMTEYVRGQVGQEDMIFAQDVVSVQAP